MSKTPEQMAEEYANESGWLEGDYVWREAEAGFLAGYEAAKDEMNSSKKLDSWISVEERLPEDEREVLVVYCGEGIKDVHMSWYEGDEFGWATLGYVSHWMELPEPPKEEK